MEKYTAMKNALLTGILLIAVSITQAQEKLGEKILSNTKEKAKSKTEQEADKTVDKTLDKIATGIGGLFKKKDKNDTSKGSKENEVNSTATTTNSSSGEGVAAESVSKTTVSQFKLYSAFDFVPGEKVIAMEDFSNTSMGDFPLGWNTNSSAELVRMGDSPVKWLQLTKDGFIQPEFIKEMPENFTIEFDVFTRYRSSNILEYQFQIASSDNPRRDLSEEYTNNYFILKWLACSPSTSFYVGENGEIVNKNEGFSVEDFTCNHEEHLSPVHVKFSIWRQKNRLRVYANENKIVDIPQAFDSKLKYNVFKFGTKYMNFATSDHKDEFMVSNIRYAIGAADTRSKLISEGKLVTRGILFETNSDVINNTSYGVLKDIANVLVENPTVKIKIIGHTDSDGETEANLVLSQKRANAVKNILSSEFKVDETRMQTEGKGESEPSDSNSTPAGKANNRRVEFIKL